jgi:hypothetical protein
LRHRQGFFDIDRPIIQARQNVTMHVNHIPFTLTHKPNRCPAEDARSIFSTPSSRRSRINDLQAQAFTQPVRLPS